MIRSRVLSIFIMLILLFSCTVVLDKLDIKIIENATAAYCTIQNQTMYWGVGGEVNISIWDTGEDPVSADNYTITVYNDNEDNVTQNLTICRFDGYCHINSISWGIDPISGYVYGNNGTWSADILHVGGEWECSATWTVIPAPDLLWIWVDDDGVVDGVDLWGYQADNHDGIIPYIPEIDDVPLDIQFQILIDGSEYFGEINQQQAMESITISGDVIFNGTLDKIPDVTFIDDKTWNVPIIPTMSLGGGLLYINVNAFNSSCSATIVVGGYNYGANGSIVYVTPNDFSFGNNLTFSIDVYDAETGVENPYCTAYLYYVGDVDGGIPGDPIETHIIGYTTAINGDYYLNFNTTQQTANQTIAGFDSIKARRNLTIYVVGPGHREGYALIEMKPSFPINVYIDDNYNPLTPGWGYDHFDCIQDGVDAVNNTGTVYVFNGTYYENVIAHKTINLVGENKDSTIIDGGYNDDVVSIFADNVSLTGFTIQHSGNEIGNNAILIQSNNNYICDNNILNSNFGITIDSSDRNIIMRNNVNNTNWVGIYLLHSSSNNTIRNNGISNNHTGIYLLHSINNIVSSNYVKSIDTGISLFSSSNNMIKYNIIIGNDVNPIDNHGIKLYKSSTNEISYNEIKFNSKNGIMITQSSCENIIINNNILSNNNYGIIIEISTGDPSYPSNNNIIYHNNFINNNVNSYDECNNTWNDSYPSGGNYWSDYWGDDENHDGIGDVPYDLPCEHAVDYFPLMRPWGENLPVANFTYEINGATVTFNPFSSYDRDGDIISMGWDFGEGIYVEGPPKIMNHTYEQPGTYNVSLKVIDDDGLYDWMTKQIEVENGGYEFETILLIGRITNLNAEEDIITFEAVNLRAITFFPFSFNPYSSGKKITILKDYIGLAGTRFIFALCSVSI